MSFSGKLIPGAQWLHAHRLRYGGVMLLASSLAELSFSCDSFGLYGVSGEHAFAHNMTRTLEKFASPRHLVCTTNHSVVDVVWIHRDRQNFPYERQGALSCGQWTFKSGDPYVYVGWFQPRWERHTLHLGMHLNIDEKRA